MRRSRSRAGSGVWPSAACFDCGWTAAETGLARAMTGERRWLIPTDGGTPLLSPSSVFSLLRSDLILPRSLLFARRAYPSTRSISSWWEWMPSLAYTCFTWAFTVLRDTTSASSM